VLTAEAMEPSLFDRLGDLAGKAANLPPDASAQNAEKEPSCSVERCAFYFCYLMTSKIRISRIRRLPFSASEVSLNHSLKTTA
jgi:hypothetical protein